jgi:hypothetical protein
MSTIIIYIELCTIIISVIYDMECKNKSPSRVFVNINFHTSNYH